jgi:hypothetical protein
MIKKMILSALALLVITLGLLLTLDLGFLRGGIESRVQQLTGRSFVIGQDLSIRLGRDLVITAGQVQLGNPAWANDENFIQATKLQAVIDPLSLLKGLPLIKSLAVTGLDINLQINEEDQNTWLLGVSSPTDKKLKKLPFLLESIFVTDSKVNFQAPFLDQPIRAVINLLDDRVEADGLIHSRIEGSINSEPVLLDISGGPYANIITGDNFHIKGNGSFGDITVSGQTIFDNLWTPQRPEFELHMAGPELKELTEMLGIKGLGNGDLSYSAIGTVEDEVLTTRVHGNFGEFNIDITSAVKSIQDFTDARMSARLDGPNMGRIARLKGFEGWPEASFNVEAELQYVDNGLQIDVFHLVLAGTEVSMSGKLPKFPSIRGSELTLDIDGTDLTPFQDITGLPSLPRGNFSVDGVLATEVEGLTSIDVRFAMPLGNGGIKGVLGYTDGWAGTAIEVNASGEDGNKVGQLFGVSGMASDPWSVSAGVNADNPGIFELTGVRLKTTNISAELSGRVTSGVLGFDDLLTGTEIEIIGKGGSAAVLGQFVGIDGLPSKPWTASAGVTVTNPDVFEIGHASFNTEGLSAGLTGSIGVQSLGKDTDVRITARADQLSSLQQLLDGDFTLPDQHFSFEGRAKALEDAWQLTDVQIEVGTSNYKLNGKMAKHASLSGSDLSIEASGTDPGKIFDLPGRARLPDGPFTSSGQISLTDRRLKVSQMQMTAGSFNLDFDAEVPWPLDASSGSFKLQSSGVDIARVLPELVGLKPDPGEWSLGAEGSWNDGQITIREGDFAIADSLFTARGLIDLPPNLSATDFDITLRSEDLSRFGTIDGAYLGVLPVDIRTSFAGNGNQFTMDRFEARIGDSDVVGSLFVDFEPEVPEFDLQFMTSALNLQPFEIDPSEKNADLDTGAESDDRFFPDVKLPLKALRRINGRFLIQAGEVFTKRITLSQNTLRGELQNGRLTVQELGTDGYDGRLVSTINLLPVSESRAIVSVTANSEGLILNLAGLSEEDKKNMPAFDIDATLEATGESLRELAGSLNGQINSSSPGGLVKDLPGLDGGHGLFVELLSAISPSVTKQASIEISCVALAATIEDGLFSLDPGFVLQTDKLNIFAKGKVNLTNENIDINFNTQTRSAVKLSASELVSPYVKLSGTMANPSITLDTKGTLISGGAAYLSGGLSILAKKALDQLGGTSDPCEGMVPSDG